MLRIFGGTKNKKAQFLKFQKNFGFLIGTVFFSVKRQDQWYIQIKNRSSNLGFKRWGKTGNALRARSDRSTFFVFSGGLNSKLLARFLFWKGYLSYLLTENNFMFIKKNWQFLTNEYKKSLSVTERRSGTTRRVFQVCQ